MKPSRKTAGLLSVLMVVGLGGAVGISATAAQAASTPAIHLYGQINNNSLSGNQDLTTHQISVTISPTTGGTSTPVEIKVSSSDLILCNGPAASAGPNAEELDAIVSFGGTEYALRGPQNTVTVPASSAALSIAPACQHSVINSGWTVSSTAGNSVGTSDTSATPATTGLGAYVFNRATSTGSLTPVVGGLKTPATAGSYPVVLEALDLNSLGTSSGLYDDFDEAINTDSTNACANSATCAPATPAQVGPGGTPGGAGYPNNPGSIGAGSFFNNNSADYITDANLSVVNFTNGPTANVTAQNLGATDSWTNATTPTPLNLGSGGVPYVRTNDVLNITTGNALWGATNEAITAPQPSTFLSDNTGMALSLCPVTSTAAFDTTQGCAPGVAFWKIPGASGPTAVTAGSISTTGGSLNPFSIELTSVTQVGAYNIWIVKCDNPYVGTGGTLTNQKACTYNPNNNLISATNTSCAFNANGTVDGVVGAHPIGYPCPAVTGYGPTEEAQIPVQLLGNRSIGTGSTVVSTGSPIPVTGSNWYPGESVSIKGGVPGSAVAGVTVNGSSITCSNGTGTVTMTTAASPAPALAAGSYIGVANSTKAAGAFDNTNAKVSAVNGTNIVTLSKTQNGTTTTAGTFTLGFTINGTPFTVGPEQYNVSSAQLQTDISNALTANSLGSVTATVSSGAATGNRTIIFAGATSTAVTATNVISGYAPANVVSTLAVGATNSFSYVQGSYACGANGTYNTGADTATLTNAPGTPSAVDTANVITASSTGTISGTVTISDITDKELYATGIQNDQGAANPSPVQNYAEGGSFSVSASSCVAVTGNGSAYTNGTINTGSNAPNIGSPTSGNGYCITQQTINATVIAGTLRQDASNSGLPLSSNPSPTVVQLGSLPTSVTGGTLTAPMNTITVSDSRGGTFGWSLSATATPFTGVGGHHISNADLAITPACVVDPGYTALSATGEAAGAAAQTFAGTVNLCTKDNTINATTQSTGGVYDVSGPLTLTVPAFQAADVYSTVMTVTLQ